MDHGRNHANAVMSEPGVTDSSADVPSSEVDALELAAALRSGLIVDDDDFDRFIPHQDRRVSGDYWTPIRVALRISQWLEYFGARSVVDVGSGVGKFCVAAALVGRCQFIGIEHRPRLVAAARTLAQAFGVEDRVDFVQSKTTEIGWPKADAYYLYNPFGENLCSYEFQLDRDVELGIDRYKHDIAEAERFVDHAPRDTFLITYNGFGGRVPDSYEEVAVDRDLPYELRMWRKTRQAGSGRVLRLG